MENNASDHRQQNLKHQLPQKLQQNAVDAVGDGKLIDISIPLTPGGAVWPGDTPFSCGWIARRGEGSSVNLAALTMSAHAGTHADAPLHVESAWGGSESLPIDVFIGTAVVLQLPVGTANGAVIGKLLLRAMLDSAGITRDVDIPARILCRTGCTVASGLFPASWPVLDADAIAWLLSCGVRLWGTDAPSVDARTSVELPVHHALFNGAAYVLENLALDGVALGVYELLAQPVAIVGADAAPVRALLRIC